MSIYGSNPSRSTWEFDGLYETVRQMQANASKILYGRHVYVIDDSNNEAGVYQKTNDESNPFIYIGRLAPSLAGVSVTINPSATVQPDARNNSGSFDIDQQGNTVLKLNLGTLKDLNALEVNQAAIFAAATDPNGIRLFTWPQDVGQQGTIPVTPYAYNGVLLKGNGVGFELRDGEQDEPKQLIMTAAPAWRTFTESALEVPEGSGIGSGGSTVVSGPANLNANYDSGALTIEI